MINGFIPLMRKKYGRVFIVGIKNKNINIPTFGFMKVIVNKNDNKIIRIS